MEIRLAALQEGEQGTVLRLGLEPDREGSLRRLGLIPGTELRCLRRSPLGDPTVYRFRGTDIAIRRRDAAQVEIRKLETETGNLFGGEDEWQ